MLISLALMGADPALAGGAGYGPPPPAGTVIIETPCPQTQPRRHRDPCVVDRSARSHVSTHTRSRTVVHASHGQGQARRAGEAITLSDGFFAGGLTGGVERPVQSHAYYGRHVVVVGTGHAAPRSAGQAAAARGLPRP